jgi:multidrug transporter EmrE-like cation transporter
VVACVEYIIAWFNYSKLCQWLNNWNEIEIDLRNKERQKIVQFNITTQVKWLGILYIAFPAIVFGTMITESDVDIHYPAWTMLCISYSYISTMCIFAEDAKILLMLHIINCAFKEVIKIHRSGFIINCKRLNFDGLITTLRSDTK